MEVAQKVHQLGHIQALARCRWIHALSLSLWVVIKVAQLSKARFETWKLVLILIDFNLY